MSGLNIYWSDEGKPLNASKIDWRCKPHTNASMIKEGVYPPVLEKLAPETIQEIVLKTIGDGTFGGRWDYFGFGKFRYIAYTD